MDNAVKKRPASTLLETAAMVVSSTTSLTKPPGYSVAMTEVKNTQTAVMRNAVEDGAFSVTATGRLAVLIGVHPRCRTS